MAFKPAHVHGAGEDRNNEAHRMQIDLNAVCKQKIIIQTDFKRMQQTQKSLFALGMNMHQFEEKLDCLFRSLVKIRVSILNVSNQ